MQSEHDRKPYKMPKPYVFPNPTSGFSVRPAQLDRRSQTLQTTDCEKGRPGILLTVKQSGDIFLIESLEVRV